MRDVTLVLGGMFINQIRGDVIGVDRGALRCAQRGIVMKCACGDFDSIKTDDMPLIAQYADTVITLNPEKDVTDFTYALSLCEGYESIYVIGGLGGRRDHEYVIVESCKRDARIQLLDAQNMIKRYDRGVHSVSKGDFTYFSILALEPSIVSLKGFKYPLNAYEADAGDLGLTSNEILDTEGEIIIHEGSFLVIQSKDA